MYIAKKVLLFSLKTLVFVSYVIIYTYMCLFRLGSHCYYTRRPNLVCRQAVGPEVLR